MVRDALDPDATDKAGAIDNAATITHFNLPLPLADDWADA